MQPLAEKGACAAYSGAWYTDWLQWLSLQFIGGYSVFGRNGGVRAAGNESHLLSNIGRIGFETNWGSFHWPRPTGEKAKTKKYSHEILHSSRSKNTAMYGRKVTTVLSECRAAALACYKRLIRHVSLLLFSQSSSTCALLEKELLGSTSGMGMFYFCLQEGFPLLVPV